MPLSPYFMQQGQQMNPNMMPGMQGFQGVQAQPRQKHWGDKLWDALNSFGKGVEEFTIGKPGGIQQIPNFDQQQMQALNQILGGGLEQLMNPYQGFEDIANQARTGFNQQTIPSIAERFASMGGSDTALSSPAFAGHLGTAGKDLETQLAAMRQQYGMQNRQLGLQQSSLGLTPQNSMVQTPGSGGLFGGIMDLLKGAAPGVGQAVGAAGAAKYLPLLL